MQTFCAIFYRQHIAFNITHNLQVAAWEQRCWGNSSSEVLERRYSAYTRVTVIFEYCILRTSTAIGEGTTGPSTCTLPGTPSRSYDMMEASHEFFLAAMIYVTSMLPRNLKVRVPSLRHIHEEITGASETCSRPLESTVKGFAPTIMWFHIERNSAVDPERRARKPEPCSPLSGKADETINEAASSGERPKTSGSMKQTTPFLISAKNSA
mmetsp:Transcript_56284/g.93078  ORF Transcript_56284/g.93078 Transcript_56284/m.93078 type:complete len:210 (+) Transcript_56284:192-821(+)